MIRLTWQKWRPVAFVIIGLRIVVPLLVWIQPFWATIICMVLDIIDNPIILNSRIVGLGGYQLLDKMLDSYYYVVLWVYSLPWGLSWLTALFAWRIVGDLLVIITKQRKLFIVFPNVFEHMFQVFAYGFTVNPSALDFINQQLLLIF